MTKMNFNGKWVDVERVEMEKIEEPWVEIYLKDGIVIRERLIVTGVYRIIGQFDMYRNPSYYVASQNVVDVISPEELKQPVLETSAEHPGHFV